MENSKIDGNREISFTRDSCPYFCSEARCKSGITLVCYIREDEEYTSCMAYQDNIPPLIVSGKLN